MEHIEKVAIGLILFAVTSVLAYLFRMRQLYVAAPKLYRHAPISKGGSLCEIIVYNRGNQPEEQIHVALDPDLKVELLASGSSDISLDMSTLKIERLHKGCEASAMLLVENGVLDFSKVTSVSSKATSGKVCKKPSDVPPNFAGAFLVFCLFVGIIPGMIYGFKAYEKLSADYVDYQLGALQKLGWSNLSRYYKSDVRSSYSNEEFPLSFKSRQKDGSGKPALTFEAYNKTALPMKIYVDLKGDRAYGSPYFASADVEPMSRASLTTRAPAASADFSRSELEFSIKVGSEFLHGISFLPVSASGEN